MRKKKNELLINNELTLKSISGSTDYGWDIASWEWLFNIDEIPFILKWSGKTIKRELLNGDMKNLLMILIRIYTHFLILQMFLDSIESKYKSKNKQKTKILKYEKIKEFIVNELDNKQSLKAIIGRSKIAYWNGEIEQPIPVMKLYSYINNENVLFINYSHFKEKTKHKYRTKNYCKRQNSVSIFKRSEYISNNQEFGHWEMDLVIGNKKNNVNLLTLYERKSKIGVAIKIYGKEAKTITKTLRHLQSIDRLIYGVNIKSITTDNGLEFYDWKKFKKSIYNAKDNIDVYFATRMLHEKKVELKNFNRLIRTTYPKGFDFETITQEEIDKQINKINEIYCETLRFCSAKEKYNELSLTNWAI